MENPSPHACGVSLIQAERVRHQLVEGWTPAEDDRYISGELIDAAVSYGMAARLRARDEGLAFLQGLAHAAEIPWPWEDQWWKPSEDNIRNLVKAGALIAAEIDRLLRRQPDYAPPAQAAPCPWHDAEQVPPPRDGSPIVAMGNLLTPGPDGDFDVAPFLEIMLWNAGAGEWVDENGLSIRRYADAELTIHDWLPAPSRPS